MLFGLEWNSLALLESVELANTLEGLNSGINMIRRHSILDLGRVMLDCWSSHFERLRTSWLIKVVVFRNRGCSTRVQRKRRCVRRSVFFDEFRLFDVRLVASKRFFTVAQQTGSGFQERSRCVRTYCMGPEPQAVGCFSV